MVIMKIPFLPIHIFTGKRLFQFAEKVRERQEKDNKIIAELMRENALLESSTEYWKAALNICSRSAKKD